MAKVGEQVVDIKDGVGIVLTDGNVYGSTVLFDDNAVECKRGGNPLVLADAAVVMGFEECHTCFLVNGALLQVNAGGVNVCGGNAYALFNGTGANHKQVKAFVAVVVVIFTADGERISQFIRQEAACLCHFYGYGNGLALGFSGIKVCLVRFSKGVCRLCNLLACLFIYTLLFVKQLFL